MTLQDVCIPKIENRFTNPTTKHHHNMRTETIIRTIYTFEELTPEAQDKALDNCRDTNTYDFWYEADYEDAEQAGLKITSFGLDRNRHAKGHFIDSAQECARLIMENHGEHCSTHATAKDFLSSWADAVKEHSDGIQTDRVCEEKECDFDEVADDLENDFLQSILEDYAIILQNNYEYQYSDEAVKETIEANAYEFTEDGERI